MKKIAKTIQKFDQYIPQLLSIANPTINPNPKLIAIYNIMDNIPAILNQPLNQSSVPGSDPNISSTILSNRAALKSIKEIYQYMAIAQSNNQLPNLTQFSKATTKVLSELSTIISNINQNKNNTNLLSDKSYNIDFILNNLKQIHESLLLSNTILNS